LNLLLLVFGRLFLLFLLGCDWAGDPYDGQSPLSQPLGSQEVYCYSIEHAETIFDVTCEQVKAHAIGDVAYDLPCSTVLASSTPPPFCMLNKADPLYAFMSLQR
jgi:hypothetical protein